jgi:hypothetical protein
LALQTQTLWANKWQRVIKPQHGDKIGIEAGRPMMIEVLRYCLPWMFCDRWCA